MNVILDYDVGNLDSIENAFKQLGISFITSKDPNIIKECHSLILPGVGAFEKSMKALEETKLIPVIKEHISKGKYLLGICIGMQLLYEKSDENGEFEGLGIFKGTVNYLDVKLKIPHMGWNQLKFKKRNHPILKYIKEDDYVYFVHSYYVQSNHDELLAYTNYEKIIPAIVSQGNVYATQFHPEKSGTVGLNILKAYGEMIK